MGNLKEDNLEKGDTLIINKRKRRRFGMVYATNAIVRTSREVLEVILTTLKHLVERKQCRTLRMPTGIELLSKSIQAYYVSKLRAIFSDTEITIT